MVCASKVYSAATIVAIAAYTGVRKSELRGLLLENYDGERVLISQSFWRGHVLEPKTSQSNAPVPVIAQRLLRILRRAHQRGARLVSICSGAFVLAATGLLDGRRATTHWRYAAQLAQMYPRIRVEPDVLYVDEGDMLTSAGSAAGIDLCLHIVRKDFGESVANQVARRLVVYPHRDGGQAQFVERAVPKEDRPWLAKLLEWTQNHLGDKLSVKHLAKQAGMSKRTLSRRFAEELATSPIEWLIALRLVRAKQMLEKTARTVDEIAYDAGFGSAPTLRHHFRQRLNTSPVAYRSHFR